MNKFKPRAAQKIIKRVNYRKRIENIEAVGIPQDKLYDLKATRLPRHHANIPLLYKQVVCA